MILVFSVERAKFFGLILLHGSRYSYTTLHDRFAPSMSSCLQVTWGYTYLHSTSVYYLFHRLPRSLRITDYKHFVALFTISLSFISWNSPILFSFIGKVNSRKSLPQKSWKCNTRKYKFQFPPLSRLWEIIRITKKVHKKFLLLRIQVWLLWNLWIE